MLSEFVFFPQKYPPQTGGSETKIMESTYIHNGL